MTGTPTEAASPRPGRPPIRGDGKAMTNAERQRRRRKRLIAYEPLLEVLVDLAELERGLRAALHHGQVKETVDAYYRVMRMIDEVALMVPDATVTRTWGERERRRREMAQEAAERDRA